MSRFIVVAVVVLQFMGSMVAAETVRFFPAAASAAGVGDSFFVTDARIFNPDPVVTITVHLAYLERDQDNINAPEIPVEVPPRTSLALDDIVQSVFGIEGAGGVRLRSDGPFLASSRTYNLGGDNGTFGQFIPGSAPEDALTSGILLSISNDPSAGGSRSNIGFANPQGASTTVTVEVHDSETGESLGSRSKNIPPLAVYQINDVFNWVGVRTHVSSNATVEFRASTPVLAYASVLDNTSSDPFYGLAFADRGSSGDGNNPPVPVILRPGGDLTIGAGSAVFFGGSVTDPDGDLVSWEWDFGDGITSGELIPGEHTFSERGVYEVLFSAVDEHGLTNQMPDYLTITVIETEGTLRQVQDLVFSVSCARSGCHQGPSPPEGLNLEDGSSYLNIVNVPSRQQPGKDRIEPFSPGDSYLWLKVTGDPSISGSRMPRGGFPSLNQEQLGVLETWINNGALDD